MLSASAHCRSSIQITSRVRAASAASSVAQRLERQPPGAKGIDAIEIGAARGPGDRLHLKQDGEHSSQRGHISRQQILDPGRGARGEIPAQIVDHPVERLVGHRFALVAAAGQHDRIALQLPDELAHERALPDSGWSVDRDRPGPAREDFVACLDQRVKLGTAPDEREIGPSLSCSPGGDSPAPGIRARRTAAPVRRRAGSRRRRPMQMSLRSAGTAPGCRSAGAGGSSVRFRIQHVRGRAVEGQDPGQHFVERHADAVPIARLRRRGARRLFG